MDVFHLSSHVNVLKLLGYTCWEGFVGVVTEYAAAGDLKSLLLSSSNPPSDRSISMLLRLRFCSEIASGLAFLQSKYSLSLPKFSAGDVLLDRDFRCKIADFKFSNVVVPALGDKKVETVDFVLMMRAILSLRESEENEARSDVKVGCFFAACRSDARAGWLRIFVMRRQVCTHGLGLSVSENDARYNSQEKQHLILRTR